jgi:hypothetical protein
MTDCFLLLPWFIRGFATTRYTVGTVVVWCIMYEWCRDTHTVYEYNCSTNVQKYTVDMQHVKSAATAGIVII